jgi:hypothetical protein
MLNVEEKNIVFNSIEEFESNLIYFEFNSNSIE